MKSIAYVLLILVCMTFDMLSDLYLRTREITGVDPHSWDVVCSIGVILGGILLLIDALKDWEDNDNDD